MSVILKKRGKYLEGSSYCTGFPERYHWTSDQAKARRFCDDEDHLYNRFARSTGAALVKVPSTRQELKQMYKRIAP